MVSNGKVENGGNDDGDDETEPQSTDPKYFTYRFINETMDEKGKTAIITGGNDKYCITETYYLEGTERKAIKYIQDGGTPITEIVIPKTVLEGGENYTITTIEYGCFAGSGFTAITIPDTVTSIENYAFYGCTGLTSITIPEGVTSIGDEAFSGCSSLTSIEFPEGVTTMGDYVFSNCTGLTSVTIPEGVTSHGMGVFYGCNNLINITIDSEDIAKVATMDNGGELYLLDNATTIYIKNTIPEASLGSYIKNFTKAETSDKAGYTKYTRNISN